MVRPPPSLRTLAVGLSLCLAGDLALGAAPRTGRAPEIGTGSKIGATSEIGTTPEIGAAPAAGGVGLAIDPAASPMAIPEGLRSPSHQTPCYLLLTVGRPLLETPAAADSLLEAARDLGLRVVIRVTDEGGVPATSAPPGAAATGGTPPAAPSSTPAATSAPPAATSASPAGSSSAPAALPAASAASALPLLPGEPWIAQVASFAAHAGGRVYAYQIIGAPAALQNARVYSYLLKRAAVAIRGAQPGARILSANLGREDGPWLESLYATDAAPYIDVLAARGLDSVAPLAALRDRLDPSAAIWAVDTAVDPDSPSTSAAHAYFGALYAGAEVVLFGPPQRAPAAEMAPPAAETAPAEGPPAQPPTPPPAPGTPAPGAPAPQAQAPQAPVPQVPAPKPLGELLARMRAMLPRGMSPASPAALPFDPAQAGLEVLPFLQAERREVLAVYRSSVPAPGGAARFTVRAPLEWVDLFDPRAGGERRLGSGIRPGSVLEVPAGTDDRILHLKTAAEAAPLQENLNISGTTELTAEEIIALEREFRAAQVRRLRHYEARASVNIHYRIASLATSVDVLTENRLFVHDGQQDYQQTSMFVDGARWRGKTPPYLPFLQPDKVKEVPLDIVLDEGYRYALLGREKVDGRECYVIAMAPTASERSLYEGRVYIDTKIFARVRMDAVQTNLKNPLLSNHVTYRFGPVASREGVFWLPIEVVGQMIFVVLDQNLAVERDVGYSDFSINQEGFETRVSGAYGSGYPIFRDTPEGYYHVDRSGGQERLESISAPRNVLLVMGADVGLGSTPGLPFAGVNFFDFDFHGTGHQFDLAWAGPFADISWTNPHLTHPGTDRRPMVLTLNGTFNALPGRDKHATEADTSSAENVDLYRESMDAALSLPMGHYMKWTLDARATYNNFSHRHDTGATFVLPATHVEGDLGLRLEVNRAGYVGVLWGEAGQRSTWEPWGLPNTPFNPGDRDFTRKGFDVLKSIYLGRLQKISLGLSGYDGKGLDRFSRFELGDFRSARVQGFNGSGIHFDRGLVVNAGYAFTLAGAVRVDTQLESGFIQSPEDFGTGTERVVGAGLALEFSGPWSTLVNMRVGYGLSSTIPDKGGGGDVRVVLFKTFNRWSRRPRP